MTDDERRKLEHRYRHLSVDEIQDSLRRGQFSDEGRDFLRHFLEKRRADERVAADEAEQACFEKRYEQTERHHQESKRAARIAAVISNRHRSVVDRSTVSVAVATDSCPASPPPAIATPSPTGAPTERQ